MQRLGDIFQHSSHKWGVCCIVHYNLRCNSKNIFPRYQPCPTREKTKNNGQQAVEGSGTDFGTPNGNGEKNKTTVTTIIGMITIFMQFVKTISTQKEVRNVTGYKPSAVRHCCMKTVAIIIYNVTSVSCVSLHWHTWHVFAYTNTHGMCLLTLTHMACVCLNWQTWHCACLHWHAWQTILMLCIFHLKKFTCWV